MSARSSRFGLWDLIVVVAILVVIFELLAAIHQRARTIASRVKCVHNLHEMAMGIHIMTDANEGRLPSERPGRSIFVDLLPFVEGQDNYRAMVRPDGNVDAAKAWDNNTFLCASRRTPRTGPAIYTNLDSAKGDYGYASDTSGDYACGGEPANGTSILAAPAPLTLGDVANADGTGTTLLLAQKCVRTTNYTTTGKNDAGWATWDDPASKKSGDHLRSTGAMEQDGDEDDIAYEQMIGSPHRSGCPCVFADGHTSLLPYSFERMKDLWAFDDGNLPPPSPP